MIKFDYNFGRSAVRRGRIFCLVFGVCFALMFAKDLAARFGFSYFPLGTNSPVDIGDTAHSSLTLVYSAIMSLMGFGLFAFATFLLKKFSSPESRSD